MSKEHTKVYEARCQNCGEWSWVILGLCGDCAPASYHRYYEEWWNSPKGLEQRTIAAEQALSALALEKADQQLQSGQGAEGQK